MRIHEFVFHRHEDLLEQQHCSLRFEERNKDDVCMRSEETPPLPDPEASIRILACEQVKQSPADEKREEGDKWSPLTVIAGGRG